MMMMMIMMSDDDAEEQIIKRRARNFALMDEYMRSRGRGEGRVNAWKRRKRTYKHARIWNDGIG